MEYCNPHDKNRDKGVQQHPQFDKQRRFDNRYHAEDEYPVLEHQIADDLHQRAAPADDHEEADGDDKDRGLEHQQRRVRQRRLQLQREPNRQPQCDDAKEDRGDKPDKRLDLAGIAGARAQAQQHPRENHPFEGDIAGGEQYDPEAEPVIMGDQRYQAEEDALERQPADAGADAARPEQREAGYQGDCVDAVEGGGHLLRPAAR